MIASRQQLQHNARTLQSRATTMTALFMTIMLLCIEHVRAFANQYHISAHDAMVLASAASSLSSKLKSNVCVSNNSQKKTIPKSYSFLASPGKAASSPEGSSTQLNAWSMGMISMPSMPSMPTRKDLPVHTLGSWYSEVDPTTKPPVYDDEYENTYSFSSPTDDWPSMSSDMEESSAAVQSHMRRGPLKTIKRVAGKFKDILVQ